MHLVINAVNLNCTILNLELAAGKDRRYKWAAAVITRYGQQDTRHPPSRTPALNAPIHPGTIQE